MKVSPIFAFLFFTALISCKSQEGVQISKDPKGFQKLSEYHLFEGKISDLMGAEGVIPYELNSTLFTDYAEKKRFVWMPKGVSAVEGKEGRIDYPDKTILVKNFFYTVDGKRNIIETRLLINYSGKWNAYTYVWNKEQTDAELEVAGADIPTTMEHNGEKINFVYSVPNRLQCKSCHNYDNKFMPIGPKIANLNRDLNYDEEGESNQLDYWVKIGYLQFQRDSTTPVLPNWENTQYSLEQRAKAYLDVNCSHCHNPKGPANTSGLFLQYFDQNPTHWGVCKTPVAAGRGSGGRRFDIVPGLPDQSILVYRIESLDPGAMMPELGRKMVHQEAVDLIKDWISSIEATQCN